MIKIDKIHFQLKYPLLFNTKSQANPVWIFFYGFFNLCYSSIIIFCLRKCVVVLKKYSDCVRVEFRIGADCIEWTSTMTLSIQTILKICVDFYTITWFDFWVKTALEEVTWYALPFGTFGLQLHIYPTAKWNLLCETPLSCGWAPCSSWTLGGKWPR